ncbi:MAG TPA: mannosyltransferase family protein [Ktedonobacterales bacterium]|nr:mannosyltransferase family protein [Ktedonobacterales bacterium]
MAGVIRTTGAAGKTSIPGQMADAGDARPAQITFGNRAAWRDALIAWVASRAALALLTFAGQWLVSGHAPTGQAFIQPWTIDWDAAIYSTLATTGYTSPVQAAFFPLLPLLEHVAAIVFGGNTATAGIVLANVASLGAFGLLRVLIEREAGQAVARRTLLYLVIFPTAFFLAAGYTEALFLLLSIGAFLALRSQRWLLAGGLAALAALTRPVGILLVVACAAEAWQLVDRPPLGVSWAGALRALRARGAEWLRMAGALALPPLAVAAFSTYLYSALGNPTAITSAFASGWGTQLSWPWDGLVRAVGAALTEPAPFNIHATLDIAFVVLFIVLTVASLWRLPLPFTLYACANLALVLLTPTHISLAWFALASDNRYMLSVFPLFWLLARWGERRWLHLAIVTVSLLLFVFFTLAYANGAWVG